MTSARRTLASRAVSSRGARWAVVALLVVGCGRQQSSRGDSAAAAPPPSAAAIRRVDSASPTNTAGAATVSTAPACVSEGAWRACSVEKRLTDAGYVPINKGAAPAGIFPVAGTTYALGQAQAHVYVFASVKEREAAVAAIDTTTVSRRGVAASWPLPPTFIASSNVVVVLVSDNGRMIERVQNAIRAGLPSATH